MPHRETSGGQRQNARIYPYGIGDGTRSRGVRDAEVPTDGNNEENKEEAPKNEEAANDAPNEAGGDQGIDEGYRGVQAQEQIITVSPDQAIKLVITSQEGAKPEKKEHPQDLIKKFWTNFEPEYLGGITQILPDAVGQAPVSAKKKSSSDDLPSAVHSYENARQSCIRSVKRIVRECKANNKKYTDPHFDIERDLKVTQNRDCLYGLTTWDGTKDPGDVKRVTDIFDHPQFFKDGAGFDDIVQGSLGDCWFLAGLSAVTSNQELLRKVCVIQDQDVGVYGFVFHRDGDWHPCIIDDKLYLSAPNFDETGETVLERYGVRQQEQEKMYQETLQRGSKALYFASCRDENETWVPLFEKAYAKAHGDYTALDGGQVGEALEDLTGGVTTEIYTTDIMSKDAFWRDLRRIGKDFIFSCHVSLHSDWRGTSDYWESEQREKRLKGIIEQHAYSVLDTYEGYGQKLVKVRNPWGEKEWNGAWSDGSKEWTADWLYRLEHKFGDDGVFWMSYDDMLRRYKYMDRTRLFGPEWFVAQEWTSVQVPWNHRDYQATRFTIDVPEDTEAVLALSQLDTRYFYGLEGCYEFTLTFRVQTSGDEDEDDYFARSPVNYELSRSTNVEVQLEKGKYEVLFKVEATKITYRKEIEEVIRKQIWRRDKITQMSTLYDLAYRKGRPPKEAKKPEETPAPEAKTDETKPAENQASTSAETQNTNGDNKQTTPAPADNKDDEKAKEEKKDEKSKGDAPPAENSDNKQQDQAQPIENRFLAVNSSPNGGVPSEEKPATDEKEKPTPNEKDPNRNPWNASCVVGLRVFSKIADLKLKVIMPGEQTDGVTLDRDDIAASAHVEASQNTAAESAETTKKAES